MGDISKDFDRKDFGCKCDYEDCVDIAVDAELLKVLQDVRDHFNAPLNINCSYRCEKHNADVGGATKSQHLLGTAADIWVKGIHPHKVYAYLDEKYPDKYGLGKYSTFTHIDVRSWMARF